MPSPGEDIQSWSVTAANNGAADPLINWVEGQARASVNNSSRSEMAAIAKWRNLLNGSIVTTGSPNAQQFLSGLTYTSIPNNLGVRLKIGAGLANTASATLNMDGIGTTLIKTAAGENLMGGELVPGGYADFLYDGTNWVFLYSREFIDNQLHGGGGIIIGKQIFSTPGTFSYTPTPGMELAIIECVGGGGGGNGSLTYGTTGGGGGGGAYARKYASAAEVGVGLSVTIGAGAPTGSAASGEATSVGTLCLAAGGSPGIAGQNGGAGGMGGQPGACAGDVIVGGSAGQGGGSATGSPDPFIEYTSGGAAGGLGGGGGNNTGNANAGGGGGGVYGGGVPMSGGNGFAVITEFAGRGAPGRDGATGPQGPIGPEGPAGSGTGDVLVSGTPVAGQLAQWTDTAHIKGVDVATLGFGTGDAKLTLKTVADAGWVMMDDGTIGDASSGAVTRGNADCLALFTLLFNNISDTWAPLYQQTSGTQVPRSSFGSASAAWNAHTHIALTRQLGRSLAVAGAGTGLTARVLGSSSGAEAHAITIAEMPSHVHGIVDPGHSHAVSDPGHTHAQSSVNTGSTNAGTEPKGVDTSLTTVASTVRTGGAVTGISVGPALTSISTVASGGGAAVSLMHPVSFWNIMIKL